MDIEFNYLKKKLNLPEDYFSINVSDVNALLGFDFGNYLVKTFRFDFLNNEDALFELDRLLQYSNFSSFCTIRCAPVSVILHSLWDVKIFMDDNQFYFLRIISTDLKEKESFTFYKLFIEDSKLYSKKYWNDESSVLFCMDFSSNKSVQVDKVVLNEENFKDLMKLILNSENYNDLIPDSFKEFKTEKYDEFMKGKSTSIQLS